MTQAIEDGQGREGMPDPAVLALRIGTLVVPPNAPIRAKYWATTLFPLLRTFQQQTEQSATREALERACRAMCHFCGNDSGMWEPTVVRWGSGWAHSAKNDPTNTIDCAASPIHALMHEEWKP